MKKPLYIMSVAMCGFLVASPVLAANSTVENALRKRSDLSTFYQALIYTGVMDELQPMQTYTIFAPTNEAFNASLKSDYPCFYDVRCKEEAAAILRNHIVEGEHGLNQRPQQRHITLSSIDGRAIQVLAPANRQYTVEGNKVLATNQLLGSVLYKIDGVIARPDELATLWNPDAFEQRQVSSAETVTRRVYYGPSGDPDGYNRATVYEQRTISALEPQQTLPERIR
jgi:uncharacterized surface protein with fasciclin (FAS1) repeats